MDLKSLTASAGTTKLELASPPTMKSHAASLARSIVVVAPPTNKCLPGSTLRKLCPRRDAWASSAGYGIIGLPSTTPGHRAGGRSASSDPEHRVLGGTGPACRRHPDFEDLRRVLRQAGPRSRRVRLLLWADRPWWLTFRCRHSKTLSLTAGNVPCAFTYTL